MNNTPTLPCVICKRQFNPKILAKLDSIRPAIFEHIKKEYPQIDSNALICREDLNRFRMVYVQGVLERDKGELTELEKQVIESLKENEILSKNLSMQRDEALSIGEKLADKMASFGGSWSFIILFGVVLVTWISINAFALWNINFDPYPFILLNLVLSCLAALQAPVIMMSQNRQEAKDRIRSQHDYQVNLKAELEIRHLHEKMDYLLVQQWDRLLEIQQIQLDLLQEIASHSRHSK